jgi:hypothetical protein
MNGPSGRALDEHFLEPLGFGRSETWLCDLVPHTCLNRDQARALKNKYEPRMKTHGLPVVDLPPVPKSFGEAARQEAVLAEVEESHAETIVLLGDAPVTHWLRRFDRRWASLRDFGDRDDDYGERRPVKIADRHYEILPLAHPRQVAALGSHSPKWRDRHERWRRRVTS